MQDVKIGPVLLLHQAAEVALCSCVEVPQGVDLNQDKGGEKTSRGRKRIQEWFIPAHPWISRVLQHLDAFWKSKAHGLENWQFEGVLLRNNGQLLA